MVILFIMNDNDGKMRLVNINIYKCEYIDNISYNDVNNNDYYEL